MSISKYEYVVINLWIARVNDTSTRVNCNHISLSLIDGATETYISLWSGEQKPYKTEFFDKGKDILRRKISKLLDDPTPYQQNYEKDCLFEAVSRGLYREIDNINECSSDETAYRVNVKLSTFVRLVQQPIKVRLEEKLWAIKLVPANFRMVIYSISTEHAKIGFNRLISPDRYSGWSVAGSNLLTRNLDSSGEIDTKCISIVNDCLKSAGLWLLDHELSSTSTLDGLVLGIVNTKLSDQVRARDKWKVQGVDETLLAVCDSEYFKQKKHDLSFEKFLINKALSFLKRYWMLIGAMTGAGALVGLGVGLYLGLVVGIPFFGFGAAVTGPFFAAIGLIFGGLVGLTVGILGAVGRDWFNKSISEDNEGESNGDLYLNLNTIPFNNLQELDRIDLGISPEVMVIGDNRALNNADLGFQKPSLRRLSNHVFQATDCQSAVNIYPDNEHEQLSGLGVLPEDILGATVSTLNRRSISSLMMTCRFFANSKILEVIRDSKPWFLGGAGASQTLLLTNEGSLWICGRKSRNDSSNHFEKYTIAHLKVGERIVQVAAGSNHAILLTDKGSLFVRGSNESGQLGLSHNKDSYNFIKCRITSLQAGECIAQVMAGYTYTLLLTNQGRLFVCGGPNDYDWRLKSFKKYFVNHFKKCILPDLKAGEGIVQMAATGGHTLVLTNQGHLLISGGGYWTSSYATNHFTESIIACLHVGERIVQMSAGSIDILLLTNQSNLIIFSNNFFVRKCVITDLEEGECITKVVAGDKHSLLLTNQGNLLVIGSNFYGQLGMWHNSDINVFEKCTVDGLQAGERITQAVAGHNHTLLFTNQGNLLVSGCNDSGQLGLGHYQDVNRFTKCTIESEKLHLQSKAFGHQ